MTDDPFDVSEDSEKEEELLSAADILDSDDESYVDVDVSKWWKVGEKGTVRIRSMTAREALSFRNIDSQESMISVVSRCAVDKDGNRLFTDKQVERLKKKCFAAFITIQEAAMKLNGLSTEKAKNV